MDAVRRRFAGASLLCGVGFLAPMAALAQEGSAPGLDMSALIRVTIGLAVVLALIVGLGWLVRRMGNVAGSAAGRMRVLGGVSVGNRERVVLLQVGETQLLLGVAPGRVQTLHVLDEPLDMNGAGAGSGSGGGDQQAFSRRLRQAMSKADVTPARKDPTL